MSVPKIQTFVMLVDNEAGVLSQITRLFSRKGYNIETITVGSTNDVKTSRITIEILADDDKAELLCNQIRKLFPVHFVDIIKHENSIRRELVFIKVKAEDSAKRNEIIQIANIFRANIIDVSIGALVLVVIGDGSKTAAIERILEEYEVLELVRTGIVAIERGVKTIYDDTKEKGEFNLSKNVL